MARFNETLKSVRKTIFDQVLADGICPTSSQLAREHALSEDETAFVLKELEAGICVAIQNQSHENIEYFQEEKLEVPPPELGEIFYARPFATFKNHYPVWVDGEQKWYAECAVEACGISSMFPGKEVAVRTLCRQTKAPVELVGRDGKLLHYSPSTLRVHVGFPIRKFPDDPVGWCDYNSFFSSEEAVDAWRKTHSGVKGVTRSPEAMAAFISELIGKGRLNYDYQPRLPVLKMAIHGYRYGLTKQWPVFKYFLPDPFWMPTPYLFREMKRRGYNNRYLRFPLI